MSKPIVVLLHGMGTHTSDSFKNEVLEALNPASLLYPMIGGKFSDLVEIISIGYDDIFNSIREKLANNAGTTEERLTSFVDHDHLPGLIGKINQFENKLNNDEFFYTHWLDALLYRTYFGELVRLKVGSKIVETIHKANSEQRPVHFIAHSLGTAVLHDTLNSVYAKEQGTTNQLDREENPVNAIYMIANLARLVGGGEDPYTSVVNPGTKGMCARLINVHHRMDPFTIPRPYKPPLDGSWIPNHLVQYRLYQDIELTNITQLNIHDIAHYCQDPNLYFDIFESILGFIASDTDRDKGQKEYERVTIRGKVEDLKSSLKEINFRESDSLETVINKWDEFISFLKSMTDESIKL